MYIDGLEGRFLIQLMNFVINIYSNLIHYYNFYFTELIHYFFCCIHPMYEDDSSPQWSNMIRTKIVSHYIKGKNELRRQIKKILLVKK
jgi:hypothetical protein